MDIGDNQHGTLNPARLAWLAGIVDGEGCVSLTVGSRDRNGRKDVKVSVNLQIVNSDGFIIEECADIIRNIIGAEPMIVEHGKTPDRMTTDGTIWRQNRTLMTVRVQKMTQLKPVLEAILPYLRGEKLARARLVLQFIERRLPYVDPAMRRNARYTEEDWQIIREVYATTRGAFPERLVRDYTRGAASVQ